MLPYLLLTAGAFLTSFVSKLWPSKTEERRWNLADIACVSLLVVFSATRLNVGTDYLAYQVAYDRLDPQYDWWQQVELYNQDFGYTILALMTKVVTSDPHAIYWVTSIIAIVPIYATLRKQSIDLPFAVMLYILLCFYVAPFNIIRQGMAFALVFWGYSFIKRSKIAFIIIGLIAATLHSTAIVVIVIIFVGRYWKPKVWSAVVAFVAASLVAGVIWTVPAVQGVLNTLNERYVGYVDSQESGGITVYLMIAIFTVLAILIATHGAADRPDWLALVLLGVALLVISTQSPVALRIFNYFGLFVLLALPNALAGKKHGLFWKAAVLVGAAIYFTVYVNTFANLVPYRSYL